MRFHRIFFQYYLTCYRFYFNPLYFLILRIWYQILYWFIVATCSGSQLRPLERSGSSSSGTNSKARPSIWNSLANSASKRYGGGGVSGAGAGGAPTNGMASKQLHHPENSPFPTDVHYVSCTCLIFLCSSRQCNTLLYVNL